MSDPPRVIRLHVLAPAKPAWGEPCNGCGACCLSEPCPVGMVMTRRRHGACALVYWDDSLRRYRCGAVARSPRWLRPAVLRWIGADRGCDSDAVLE